MSNIHLAARGIVVKDGKLLAVVHKSSNEVRWAIPGGSVEENESLLDAMRREMIEETGVEPQIGRLLFVQQYIDHTDPNKRQRVEFFFEICNSEDYDNIDLTKTSHGEAELADIQYIDPREKEILPRFLQTEISQLVDQAKASGPQVFSFL